MKPNKDALKYIAYYHRGVLAVCEVATLLTHMGAILDLAAIAAETPLVILAEVRRRAMDIPNPEDVSVFRFGPGFVKGTQEERGEQERIVAGLQAWESYFEAIAY